MTQYNEIHSLGCRAEEVGYALCTVLFKILSSIIPYTNIKAAMITIWAVKTKLR